MAGVTLTLPLPALLLLPVEFVCGGDGKCAPRFELLGTSSPEELDVGLGGEGRSGGVLPRKIAEDGRRRELSAGLLIERYYSAGAAVLLGYCGPPS